MIPGSARSARPARRRALAAFASVPVAAALPGTVRAQAHDGWPGLTDTPGRRMHGRWIWQELLTPDPEAAVEFYRRVFGWTTERRGFGPGAYRLARLAGRPVAGLLRTAERSDGTPVAARWIGFMSVPDVDAAVARASASGGRVLAGSALQLGRGRVALLSDPEGAPFGVLRTHGGDPPDLDPDPGEWLWRELWAADGARMAAWYRDLGHYTIRRASAGPADRDEWVLRTDDVPRAGVIVRPEAVPGSAWLPYLRVGDLTATLTAVTSAGGRALVEPSPRLRAGRVAIVADPTGATLGLAQWPQEGTR